MMDATDARLPGAAVSECLLGRTRIIDPNRILRTEDLGARLSRAFSTLMEISDPVWIAVRNRAGYQVREEIRGTWLLE